MKRYNRAYCHRRETRTNADDLRGSAFIRGGTLDVFRIP
jgi:hypothetical protein